MRMGVGSGRKRVWESVGKSVIGEEKGTIGKEGKRWARRRAGLKSQNKVRVHANGGLKRTVEQ